MPIDDASEVKAGRRAFGHGLEVVAGVVGLCIIAWILAAKYSAGTLSSMEWFPEGVVIGSIGIVCIALVVDAVFGSKQARFEEQVIQNGRSREY